VQVDSMKTHRDTQVEQDESLNTKLVYLNEMGKQVSGDAERRLKWLEIFKTVNMAIPTFPPADDDVPLDERKDFHITQVDTKHYDDLTEWWTESVAIQFREEMRSWAKITNYDVPEEEFRAQLEADPGPSGPGWVIELRCYHFYNSPKNMGFEGSNHVRKYMISSFRENSIELPIGTDAAGNDIMDTFTFAEMGLGYPLMVNDNKPNQTSISNPKYDAEAQLAAIEEAGGSLPAMLPGSEDGDSTFEPPFLEVPRLDFAFQVVWQENIISERLEARAAAEAGEQPGEPAEQDAAQPEADASVAAVQ